MSRSRDETTRQTVLPRLRLQAAQLELLGMPEGDERPLANWLKSLPAPEREGDQPLAELGMSISADRTRWTWRAAGAPRAFISVMAEYFEKVGATTAEMDRLTHVGLALDPERLGCWLEQQPGTLNAGWYLPVDLPVTQAKIALPAHASTDVVAAWAGEFGVEHAERLGRALGAGTPHAELLLPLPTPTDVETQVYAGLQLFERLKASPPPDEALSLLMNLEHQGLSVSVWLSDDGPVKLGLLAARPRTALMLELCALAGATDPEPFAALQGILGVDGPAYVECQTRAAGFGVELHYQLDLDDSLTGEP